MSTILFGAIVWTVETLLYLWMHTAGGICMCRQAHRWQWVRGGLLEPPCWHPKDFVYTALTVHFKCPSVGKWSTSSVAAIENHRRLSKSGLFLKDQHRTPARKLFTLLWLHVNSCRKNCYDRRSRVHQLSFYWCHPTYFSRENLKSAGLANACKIRWNSSYYGSAFVQKWPQKLSNFLRKTPPRLACLLALYVCIHTHQTLM